MTAPTHARCGVPVAKQKLSVSRLFSPLHPAPHPIVADTKPEPIYKIAPESSFWARGEGWDGGLSEGYLRSMPHSELCECKACRNVAHAAVVAAAARGLDRGEGKGGTWNDDRTQAQAADVILNESQTSVVFVLMFVFNVCSMCVCVVCVVCVCAYAQNHGDRALLRASPLLMRNYTHAHPNTRTEHPGP